MANADPGSSFHIEPLGGKHDRKVFSCGTEALDRYFHTQASQDVRKRVAACYVLADSNGHVAGYYTLSATSVALMDLPAERAKKLPRYPAIPAILMGRLAVHIEHRGKRFGELLLFDAFSRALRSEIASYAFVVDAKDDAAIAFYERYRFMRLTSAGRRLFLPIAEIAALFA